MIYLAVRPRPYDKVGLNCTLPHYLALAYRDGDGVSQSKEKALEYFKRAQIKKHVLAIRDYNELAGLNKPKAAEAKAEEKAAQAVEEPVDDEVEME